MWAGAGHGNRVTDSPSFWWFEKKLVTFDLYSVSKTNSFLSHVEVGVHCGERLFYTYLREKMRQRCSDESFRDENNETWFSSISGRSLAPPFCCLSSSVPPTLLSLSSLHCRWKLPALWWCRVCPLVDKHTHYQSCLIQTYFFKGKRYFFLLKKFSCKPMSD